LYAKNEFDITPEQYIVLNQIRDDENNTQNDLCKLLYKDKSNMTRILSVLEEKGYITKDTGKQGNIVKITDAGRRERDRITPVMDKARDNYLKNISQDDMYVCIKVLSQIQENLAPKKK